MIQDFLLVVALPAERTASLRLQSSPFHPGEHTHIIFPPRKVHFPFDPHAGKHTITVDVTDEGAVVTFDVGAVTGGGEYDGSCNEDAAAHKLKIKLVESEDSRRFETVEPKLEYAFAISVAFTAPVLDTAIVGTDERTIADVENKTDAPNSLTTCAYRNTV